MSWKASCCAKRAERVVGVLAACMVLYGILGIVLPKNASVQSAPNIIFIIADDLGYADLGIYGNTAIHTPNLDALADQGMVFTEYHANGPVCSPTRAAMLTGQYPHRFGIRKVICSEYGRGIPRDVVTLPGLLNQAGYATFHFGKWHVGDARPEYHPLAKGYDRFIGFLSGYLGSYTNPWLLNNTRIVQYTGHLTDILTDQAVDVIDNHAHDEPFLINLWYYAPHLPLDPHPRWADKYPNTDEGKYAAMVSTLDENVGRIMRAVESAGIKDNTLIIFTSDNGGADSTHPTGNGDLKGYKGELFQGGIKVPLFVKWPGRIPAGTFNHSLITTVDFMPTLTEILGIDTPPTDGQSLTSALFQGAHLEKKLLFWENVTQGTYTYAVREGKWKLVRHRYEDFLYDILQDPNETTNVAAVNAGVVVSLTQKYDDWRRQVSFIDYELSDLDQVYGSSGALFFGQRDSVALIHQQARFDIACCETSFGLWIKPDSVPESGSTLMAKGDIWSLSIDPDKRITVSFVTIKGPLSITSQRPLTLDKWTHVAVAKKVKRLSIFIDGVSSTSVRTYGAIVPNNDRHITIGNSAARDRAFRGWMTRPFFYSAGFSRNDIEWLYEQGPPPDGAGEAALGVESDAAPDPVLTGAPLTYTIRIANSSPADQHLTVTDVLPPHVVPSQTADGAWIAPGGVLTWTPTISAPDGVWTETFVVRTESGFVGRLPNVVKLTSKQGEEGVFFSTSRVIGKWFLPLLMRQQKDPYPNSR